MNSKFESKSWVLVTEQLVTEMGAENKPEIKLLSDAEFGDFMRGNSETTNLRFTIYELGKVTVQSKN